jgi:hypothetical protein
MPATSPVIVPTAPILVWHRQTACRSLAAGQSRRRRGVGRIADRGGKSGVARVGGFADAIAPRPGSLSTDEFPVRACSAPGIPCFGRAGSLFRACREFVRNVLETLRELIRQIAERAENPQTPSAGSGTPCS